LVLRGEQMKMRLLQAAVFVFALSVGIRADMGGCQEFSGEFTSTLVPPPACQSPVLLCTHGVLTGDVEGTYDFVATEMECRADPDDPNMCTYAGDSIVTTKTGSIITRDKGVIHISSEPAISPFVTIAESVSGTRRYRNAKSVFTATGELNFITGEAVGTYSLQICHGN
jgi:hypothetical protein